MGNGVDKCFQFSIFALDFPDIFLHFVEQPGVIDGNAGLRNERLDDREIVIRKGVFLFAVNGHDPLNLIFKHDGKTRTRAKSLFPHPDHPFRNVPLALEIWKDNGFLRVKDGLQGPQIFMISPDLLFQGFENGLAQMKLCNGLYGFAAV